MCGGPISSAESKKREAEYRAEDDHRTLTRAEEIRKDSGRMAGVARHNTKQMSALKSVGRSIKRRSAR